MFTPAFEKTAGFFDATAKMFRKPLANAGKAIASPAASAVTKPALATRLDGSAVTSNWGLKQGVRSGSIRYSDIK